MAFQQNIQKPLFWKNVFKVGLPFFVFFSIFSLLFYTGSAVFSGNWNLVYEHHFANGRWMRFLLQKSVLSLLYGMYICNLKMK